MNMYDRPCDHCGTACYVQDMAPDGREDGRGNGRLFCWPCADHMHTCLDCCCYTPDDELTDGVCQECVDERDYEAEKETARKGLL